MSLKDELHYVKEELSADEKVLESAFRLETFLKKHKKTLIGLTLLLVAWAAFYNGYSAYKLSKLEAANEALALLEQKPDDAEAQRVLRQNAPQLYRFAMLRHAVRAKDAAAVQALTKEGDAIFTDMSRYNAAVLQHQSTDSTLYRDLALLEAAYVALRNHRPQEAKERIELISPRSEAASLAALLRHATLKVK